MVDKSLFNRYAIVALFLAAIFCTKLAFANEYEDEFTYKGYPFGTSETRFIKANPGFTCTKGEFWRLTVRVCTENRPTLAGVRIVSAKAYFFRDKFIAVDTVLLEKEKDVSVAFLVEEFFTESLINKYGEPHKKTLNLNLGIYGTRDELKWEYKNSTIDLLKSTEKKGPFSLMSLYYFAVHNSIDKESLKLLKADKDL